MVSKFEVGKVYEANRDGHKSKYIVVKRNDATQRVTVQSILNGEPFGEKVSRKIKIEGNNDEVITIVAPTFGRVCWTGGKELYAVKEVA